MKQNIIKPGQLTMQSRFKSVRIHSCFTYKYSWAKKVDKFTGFCTPNTYSPYLCIPYKFPHQVCPGQPISESVYSASSWDLLFNNPFTLEIIALPKQVKHIGKKTRHRHGTARL